MAGFTPGFRHFIHFTFLILSGLGITPGAACDLDPLKSGADRIGFKLDTAPRSDELLARRLNEHKARPNDVYLWLEIGRDYLNLASYNRWDYLEQAEVFFDKLVKNHPDNPIALMLLGQATGGKALNQKPSNMRRLKWAKDGFRKMDRALKLDPSCFFLHLLRGEAQIFAHPILGRNGRMDKDAGFMMDFVRRQDYQRLPDYTKARIRLFLGTYLKKRERAASRYRNEWAQVLILAPNTPMADEAQAKLLGTYINPGFRDD